MDNSLLAVGELEMGRKKLRRMSVECGSRLTDGREKKLVGLKFHGSE
jgi:hypothetical protein